MSDCVAEIVVQRAVEGNLDEAVTRVLLTHVGVTPGDVYGTQGKEFLRERIRGFIAAAQHTPWLVLVDLDDEAPCAPEALPAWVASAARFLCLRFAVREVEAWLLADRRGIARFLGVALNRIPQHPDGEANPKEMLVGLARGSRKRDIREDLIPRPGSGRSEGPGYTTRLIRFVREEWDLPAASAVSESLQRALHCLEELCRRASGFYGGADS